jgi:16S rRNA C967 or C1407 C5-methylase (RsmB/RsmF family)
LVFDSVAHFDERAGKSRDDGRKRKNKSARAREAKRLKGVAREAADPVLFDRVLVDAECSHDGSWRHLSKLVFGEDSTAWDESRKRLDALLNADAAACHVILQQGLISNGFRRLRVGGVLVYSTCSLTLSQNEGVVRWLLEREPSARLIPAPLKHGPWTSGSLEHTLRFSTRLGTSGLFVAVISKLDGASMA